MKKLIVLLLCLAMLPVAALAGTVPMEVRDLGDNLTLLYVLPEGVRGVEMQEVYDMGIVTFDLEDDTMPSYVMVVSYSDELYEKDITELSEEEIATLAGLTAGDSDAHSYRVVEMDDGWPAVLVTYDEDTDWVDAFTVINGYFIQIHGAHKDFAPLTDAEDNYALVLLDGIDIVETEPEGQ